MSNYVQVIYARFLLPRPFSQRILGNRDKLAQLSGAANATYRGREMLGTAKLAAVQISADDLDRVLPLQVSAGPSPFDRGAPLLSRKIRKMAGRRLASPYPAAVIYARPSTSEQALCEIDVRSHYNTGKNPRRQFSLLRLSAIRLLFHIFFCASFSWR